MGVIATAIDYCYVRSNVRIRLQPTKMDLSCILNGANTIPTHSHWCKQEYFPLLYLIPFSLYKGIINYNWFCTIKQTWEHFGYLK